MKFKNLRRPARAEKAGIQLPPQKKAKMDSSDSASTSSDADVVEYDQHVKYLQKCYISQKWSLASMATLLKQTATLRRKWIFESNPPIKEILEKFPCLKEPKLVTMVSVVRNSVVIFFLKIFRS